MLKKFRLSTLALAAAMAVAAPTMSMAANHDDHRGGNNDRREVSRGRDNDRGEVSRGRDWDRRDFRYHDRDRDRGFSFGFRVGTAPAPAANGYYDQYGVWHAYGYYDQFGNYHSYGY
jgi:hypothetical protein